MKKTMLILSVFALGLTLASFTSSSKSTINEIEKTVFAVIDWDKKTLDAGQVNKGNPVKLTFEFSNSGSVPLTIQNVKPSCGCTVASFPKEPIMPGEKAEITTTYNAAKVGKFRKSVVVTSNTDPAKQTLVIKGEVI